MENQKAGWIYVFINAKQSEMVKIGKTQRNVEERLKEANKATFTPEPFEIYYTCFFQNCHQAEINIHNYLKKYRIDNKEFFKINPIEARQTIDMFFYNEKFEKMEEIIKQQAEKIELLEKYAKEVDESITYKLQKERLEKDNQTTEEKIKNLEASINVLNSLKNKIEVKQYNPIRIWKLESAIKAVEKIIKELKNKE